MKAYARNIASLALLSILLAPVSASAAAVPTFLSAGGRVVGPTDVCLSMNGGIGLLFHLIPDARVVPLVPPDYIWTPTTITLPFPGPPKPGDQVLGLVYPGFGQSLCIIRFFRGGFDAKGGWQFYYMGKSGLLGGGTAP